jgi:hypothetical protein
MRDQKHIKLRMWMMMKKTLAFFSCQETFFARVVYFGGKLNACCCYSIVSLRASGEICLQFTKMDSHFDVFMAQI